MIKKRIPAAAWAALLLLAALCLTAGADFSPLHIKLTNCDSEFFRYVARVILNGGMPYKDAVDHKGPVMFLLSTLGCAIQGARGIWILETLAVWAALLFGVRAAMRAGAGRIPAVLGTLLGMAPLTVLLTGSGRCEELALPFQMAALYCFTDYWADGRIRKGRILLAGVCFVCTEMIRQNLVALWVPWVLAIVLRLIHEKDWKGLMQCIGLFLAGMLSVAAPVYLWLWLGGALEDYFRVAWQYNLFYAANGIATPMKVLADLPVWSPLLPLGAVVNLLLLRSREHRAMAGINLAALLLSAVLVCMPGNEYLHYAILLLPCLALPFALIAELAARRLPSQPIKAALACASVLVFVVLGIAAVLPVSTGINEKANNIVTTCLKPWMREGDRLMVFDFDNIYAWNETDTFASSRLFAQLDPWMGDYEEEYIEGFTRDLPEYLLISADLQDGAYVPVGGPYFDMIAGHYSLLRVHMGKAVMIRSDYYDHSGAKEAIEGVSP